MTRLVSLGSPPAGGSAASPPLPPSACLCVELCDTEDADLLAQLPACVAFAAAAAAANASLLVACVAGVSRSASVAAAVLMSRDSLSADDALAVVAERHAGSCPNAGFVDALRVWHHCGGRLDGSSPAYRRYRVARAAASHTPHDSLLAPDPEEGAPQRGALRCRACRRLVASAEHVVAHEAGGGPAAWGAHATATASPTGPACSSLFVEPLAWMREQMGEQVAGKLSCPKCAARLGSFSWAGSRCSCAAWVTPAFQLHAARLDVAR